MSKKVCFFISLAFLLRFSGTIYGQGPLYLDFDDAADVVTEAGFTSFLISDSGSKVNDITIHLAGTLDDRQRNAPTGIEYEDIYRDFIFGNGSPITITLSGLGVNRECEITLYTFDIYSFNYRSADWTANGVYLFTAGFDNNVPPVDANSYAFTGTGYADEYGSMVLTCTQGAGSDSPYAFANALVVIPQGEYVPPGGAHTPQPVNNGEDIPVDVVLGWVPNVNADEHDVYLGTNFSLVNDANRSNPLGVLAVEGHDSNTYDPCGLLKLDTTYYWRVDEVNDPNIWKSAIWNFTTLPYFIMEDFNSCATDTELRDKWKDNATNGTRAFVSVESDIVRDGNSMKYEYKNSSAPYYSETYADIVNLGVDDADWLGMEANALVLYFRGDGNNPIDEQMYVSLTDGDVSPNTTTVMYHSMLDVTIPQWQKWNIPLSQFTDVNLANVARVTIGFGGGGGSGEGKVYFEDIQLDVEAEGSTTASGGVNFDVIYQQLEGFGGAAVYEPGHLTSHPKKEKIYDLLFKELGLEILRIRNTYNYSTDPFNEELAATAEIVAEAREPGRSPDLKTELVPWSPPAYLKSNGDESGGGTLAGGPSSYVYNDYAQWWYDSLLAWEANGVEADFISLQNEPDVETGYDSCFFSPTQNSTYAGYDQAFEAVYNKLYAEMGSSMPEMWAPCTMGFGGSIPYITALINIGQIDNVDGFSHHLYTDGNYDNPDGMITEPGYTMQEYAAAYGYKPLHMTEYVKLNTIPNFDMGMKFAWHIHNCLYYLHSASFFNWTLFRGTYSQGGIVTLSVDDYIIRPQYWFLKAYSHFTDEDWSLLGTSVSGAGSENLRISAFTSPDKTELTIVILNKSKDRTVLTMPNYTLTNSVVYRSGQTLTWAHFGPFTPEMSLPPESITTIHGTIFSNCEEVLSAGYGLTSDIHSDCYVDFKDFGVVAKYWLNTDCASQDDCEGADFEPSDGDVDYFDLGTFVQQWLWCNNPEDPNCTANWW